MQSSKPKLAILFNAFWINRLGMSGGDRRVLEIFRRIGHHFELTVYTSEDGRRIAAPCLPEARFIVNSISGNLYSSYIRRTRWASRLIQQDNYEMVYASSDFFPDVLPCHAAKKRDAHTKWFQCVFHLYPSWLIRPGSRALNLAGTLAQYFSLHLIRRRADGIITLNSQVPDQLGKLGIGKPMIVNPCGVDPAYCFPSKSDRRRHQGCFLGRLARSKGIFDLVDIWRNVVAKLPDAKLKIVGGGADEIVRQLGSRIAERGMSSSIEICGYLPEMEAFDVVRSSHVFLLPSHEEGFGIVIAEALTCGVPAVTWDLPVYREVFPAGIVSVSMGDTKRYSDEVVRLLTDSEYATAQIQAGRDVVQRYKWDYIAERELKFLTGS